MTFRVLGPDGAALGHGKDLAALQAELSPALADLVSAGAGALEHSGLTNWPVLSAESGASPGEIPRSHDQLRDGRIVRGYPALVDEDGSVALRVLTDATAAGSAMWTGTRRLLLIACPPPTRAALAGLSNREKLALAAAPHAGGAELFEDCAAACIDVLIRARGGPPWDSVGFSELLGAVRAELPSRMAGVVFEVVKILTVAQEVDVALAMNRTSPFPMAVADMRAQYDALLGPGFVASSGVDQLKHLPRYLRGISRRLERLPADPARDRARQSTVAQLSREYAEFREALPSARRDDPDVVEIRWLLEELRISLFAQQLGTSGPVSEKRILRAMDDAEARGT
jgi:ATP-dependent helicase HrpA